MSDKQRRPYKKKSAKIRMTIARQAKAAKAPRLQPSTSRQTSEPIRIIEEVPAYVINEEAPTSLQQPLPSKSIEKTFAINEGASTSGYSKRQKEEAGEQQFQLVDNPNPSGRRIINVEYFMEQIRQCNDHKPFTCNLSDMEFRDEKRDGLISYFTLKCIMCNTEKTLATENKSETSKMNINTAAVLAVISTGRGHSEMVQEQAMLDMPTLSYRQYVKHHELVAKTIYDTLWKTIEDAGKEELQLARDVGDVDDKGNGLITVIADGAWSKRSYKVNYDAPSGVGCIVGAKTGKVLFLSTRNKYCVICARAETKGLEPVTHKCSKNWHGSSTAMESDIIVEGFCNSVEMHQLKYVKLVGDGDSSVAKKLNLVRPYGIREPVRKVECTNHLLRNYCTKLLELSKKRFSSKQKLVTLQLRKLLASRIEKMRVGIRMAVAHQRKQDNELVVKMQLAVEDINNCPRHIFGDHQKCSAYFCKGPKINEINYIPEMEECGLLDDILTCGNRLIQHVHSLLLNMNNNAAEAYNSVVAKFVGGKRINFALKNSYDTRCKAAAVSYNRKEDYYSSLHKTLTKKSPGKFTKKFIERLRRRRIYRKSRKELFPVQKRSKKAAPADKDYGDISGAEEDPSALERKKNHPILELNKNQQEIAQLEENTRGQGINPLWKQEKSLRLTASNFGLVCKRRTSTDPHRMARRILDQTPVNSAAMRWGIEHEAIAKGHFEAKTGLKVQECGLYVYESFGYLGASPDGVINGDTIVEIKCPYSASSQTPEDAIRTRKVNYMKEMEGKYSLKLTHNYYYQIQGQLAIGNFQYCYFVVWTPLGMLIEKIKRDDEFWNNTILPKLKTFYMDYMLPEIIKNY